MLYLNNNDIVMDTILMITGSYSYLLIVNNKL